MGLNKSLFSIDRQLLEVKLRQLGERSHREILAVMRDEADKIAENAREFAPRDEKYLERAIEVVEDRDGINGRTQVYVQVNPDATDERGVNVFEYARMVNELLEPFGSGAWKLGEESRAKDAGRGIVGGKFIERAVITRQAIIGRKINQIARKIFK